MVSANISGILILSFGLVTTAVGQTSTANIFLPIIDSQPLVGSLSRQDGDLKTIIIKCPDGTDSSKCGFPTPVTVTAGPSTVALTTTIGNSMTVDLKCGIEGSTKASCTQMYTGPASLYTSGDGIDGAKTTTWTASQSLDSGSVNYIAVTITAVISSSSTTGSTTNKNTAATPTGIVGQVLAVGLAANIVAYF